MELSIAFAVIWGVCAGCFVTYLAMRNKEKMSFQDLEISLSIVQDINWIFGVCINKKEVLSLARMRTLKPHTDYAEKLLGGLQRCKK